MDIVIRAAREEEHPELVRLARQSPYTQHFSNRIMFSSPIAYEKGWIRVAEIEGRLVGLTCFRHKVRRPEIMLYFIVVDPALRGGGIGKMLLDDLQATAPERRVALNVAEDNRDAQRFYLREGFQVELGVAPKGMVRMWR